MTSLLKVHLSAILLLVDFCNVGSSKTTVNRPLKLVPRLNCFPCALLVGFKEAVQLVKLINSLHAVEALLEPTNVQLWCQDLIL